MTMVATETAITATTTHLVSHATLLEVNAKDVVDGKEEEKVENDNDDETPMSTTIITNNTTPTLTTPTTTAARYHASLSEYYHHLRNQPQAFSSSALSSPGKTFYYTGQGPAKCIDQDNRLLYDRVVVASSVKEILPEVFSTWTSLRQVLFEYPSQCKVIGNNAFYGCTQLLRLDQQTLPDSIQVIGSNGTEQYSIV
jgi:hypothetical protein